MTCQEAVEYIYSSFGMGDNTGMKTALRYPAPLYVFLVLAGMSGAGLVIASISLFGPGLTHDSTAYIFAAKSLLEGNGLEYFGYPSPFIQWPPLYPLLLAGAGILGIGHLEASGAINALAHGLIIAITGYWLYSRLKYKLCAIFTTILLVFSLPLIQVSKHLWTETLFILFFILFYIFFEKFIKAQRYAYLAISGIFAALACVDRYAGVTIVLTGAIFLFFQKKSFFLKVRDILIFGVISCLPFAVWVARNYMVSSTLLGVRLPSTYGLKLNIERFILSVYSWVTPNTVLSGIMPSKPTLTLTAVTFLIPVIITIIFILLFLYNLIENASIGKKKELSDNKGLKAGIIDRNYAALFMTAFTSVYAVYLLASATKVLFEPINSRYLIPLYIPLLIIFIYALDFLAEKFVAALNTFLRAGMIIIMGLFLLYPTANTIAAVSDYSMNGAGGFSTRALQDNIMVAYVRKNSQDCTYYSNRADMMGALTGIRTYYLPKRQGPYMYGLEQFKRAVENDNCSIIIWFKSSVSPTVYGIEDIGKLYGLETIKELENGTVYKILK